MQRPPVRVLIFAIFCFLLAGLAWSGARWAQNLPKQLAAATEAALEQKALELRAKFFEVAHFQPRVRLKQRIIAETTSEIAEVAILEKDTEVEREFIHTWAGSTKTLRLRGKYRVKIGFNLLNRFEIQVEKGHRRILLPPASILSVEQTEMKVEALENGYWNPISADDLQTSIAALQEQARGQSSGLVAQAEKNFATRLQPISDLKLEVVPLVNPKP